MTSAQRAPEETHDREASRPRAVTVTSIALAAVLATALSAVRLVPSPQTDDHGTYASVAERLLSGDRLYVDVWDNKDPVFYYVLALGRFVSPLADYAVEILWALLACSAAWSLARTSGLGRSWAALMAALASVVLTGPAYVPGMTHLPGVALTLWAVAAATRRQWVLAGAVVGLVVLTKVTLVPVAAVGVLTCVWHHRSWTGAVRTALAGLTALAAGIGLLAVRGELGGWVANLRANLLYADGEVFSSRHGGPVGHLLRAFPEGSPKTALFTVVAVVAVIVWAGVPAWKERAPRPLDVTGADLRVPALLASLTLNTFVASLLVLGATATWPHHGQTMSVPAVVALVLATTLLGSRGGLGAASSRGLGPPTRVAAALVTAYAVGGALHPTFYVQATREAPLALAALQQESPASALVASLPEVRTYARVGSNDTEAHALGLRGLVLECPRFHQYAFIESAAILGSTATCLHGADALIIDDSAVPTEGASPWNDYIERVRVLVSTGYDCVPSTGAQVCVRRPT